MATINQDQSVFADLYEPKFVEFQSRMAEIKNLESTINLLRWDQAINIPSGGVAARSRQIATIERIAHEKLTDCAIGELLEVLQPLEQSLPFYSYESSLIRFARRKYRLALNVPSSFVFSLSSHTVDCYEAWSRARASNDFTIVQPYLEKTLELSREFANFFPGYEHIADPLINLNDYGMKASTLKQLFADLRKQLVPIAENIASKPIPDNSFLHRTFPENEQLKFSRQIIEQIGYDGNRGRKDKTLHPFMTKFSIGDVRIATITNENDLGIELFGALHEAGHALYEQGISKNLEGTLLASGTSSGIHESQSRLWENVIGRSYSFWLYSYPHLQKLFSEQLSDITLDQFYRAINRVERSLRRIGSDEVTYNLHITIRFDLELEMLEGNLAVHELPLAWNERYKTDLGVVPSNDCEGVLQDSQWYNGTIGGTIGGQFQGYALGNLMNIQFLDAALKALPDMWTRIEQGDFLTLHNWLRENIYQHGSKYTANELIQKVTGEPLSINPFINYLQKKYAGIYGI